MSADEILRIKHISKTFPGVKVLDDISITFHKGHVHSIMGENGAGKSTFMNIIFGVYQPDTGDLLWNNQKIQMKTPVDAQKQGIAMIHQENSLIPYLSVMDNVFLGHYPKKGGFIDKEKIAEKTKDLLDELGIDDIKPDDVVERLSVAQKQLIEIVKAISLNPQLLMMDEPTAALTSKETKKLMEIIQRLKAAGVGIVYVSHRMEEVFEISDEISILRDGLLIKTVKNGEITTEEAVKLMVGRELSSQFGDNDIDQLDKISSEVIMKVDGFTSKDRFMNISFELQRGEILGFGGLVGAGRSELMEAIFGFEPHDTGTIEVNGKEALIKHPADAIALKLGMVPEERKVKGLFLDLSVEDNMNIVNYKTMKKGGLINEKLGKEAAESYVKLLSIKTTSIQKKIGQLSGGNQQKVILSRWLQTNPEILILDEPTHGIDVGAKAEIYKLISNLSAKGVSILLISSELPELLMLSSRIVVMRNGSISGILNREEFSQENVMMYATGQKQS